MDDNELLQSLVDDLADDPVTDNEPEQPKTARFMLHLKKGESEDQANARAALTSEYHAALSIFQLSQISAFKDVELTELTSRLELQTAQLKGGDLGHAESTLASHAHTLDSLFNHLLRRAALNIKNEFSVVEKLLKLALRAQSQCRATLDSLVAMKNPPELIRQTNIAHGHQQVNNFPEKPPNKLLEEINGERLDAGSPQEAIRSDTMLEAVGAKHRPPK